MPRSTPRPRSRRPSAVLVATVAAVLVTATAAAAHPGFRPSEVPAGGPVAVELVVPHGCGGDDGAEDASPTVLVLVQESDELVLAPTATAGWEVRAEDGAFGWQAVDGGTTDELLLPALVEVGAPVGTELDVAVYQECADGESYRWAAAEGEDGDPAVRLTVVEGTPPPLPSPTAAPVPTPTSLPTPSATPSPTASPTPSPTPNPTTAPTPEPTPAPSPTLAAAGADDGGIGAGMVAAIVAGLVALGLAGWFLARRGGAGTAGSGGPDDPAADGAPGGSGGGS